MKNLLMVLLLVPVTCFAIDKDPANECELDPDFYDYVESWTMCSSNQLSIALDLRELLLEGGRYTDDHGDRSDEPICKIEQRVDRCGIPSTENCDYLDLMLQDSGGENHDFCKTKQVAAFMAPIIMDLLDDTPAPVCYLHEDRVDEYGNKTGVLVEVDCPIN